MDYFSLYIVPLLIMAVVIIAALIILFIFYTGSKTHSEKYHKFSEAVDTFERSSVPRINHMADHLMKPLPDPKQKKISFKKKDIKHHNE